MNICTDQTKKFTMNISSKCRKIKLNCRSGTDKASFSGYC